MDNHQKPSSTPHVLLFPLPLQGPVNCMLKLAELLCFNHLQVTFLNTDHVQRRLLSCTDVSSRFKRYAGHFRFETVPDGLPAGKTMTGEQIGELLDSMEAVSLPLFREIVRSSVHVSDGAQNPLTCIIADGAFGFAVDIAAEFGVALMYFDTISPCGLWSILSANRLIQAGDFPFKVYTDDDLDAPVTSVPGMEGFLRRRDLPSFFRIPDQNDPIIQRVLREEQQMKKCHGLIFNSFEDLEGPILSQLKTLVPRVYTIGPLHTHKKNRLVSEKGSKNDRNSTNSLWTENKSCISWLDNQPAKSVIYVSIGSLALMGKEQLLEIWHGLANSEVRFLWVQRPGSITGLDEENDGGVPLNLCRATIERGCIVSWAPQEEVLAHPAVGGFLTHSGWNSTLESIVEGVPMICLPYFADQQINSRYVGEVWKVGLDMKDTCDRDIVEMMVRDLMEKRKDEFLEKADHVAKLAKASVSKGGASYNALNCLIEDIKLMSLKKPLW
uniref:Glycosyltransferase n=1 Tax=Gardenia jasminoides TaxID=114476 RepID=F8WKW4_GARJA|nr:UDP-glucose glucosyltransferase [Gardenia jasminoides]